MLYFCCSPVTHEERAQKREESDVHASDEHAYVLICPQVLSPQVGRMDILRRSCYVFESSVCTHLLSYFIRC